jgi:hypothetical protein
MHEPIILYGTDQSLLHTRTMMLRQAGFVVLTANGTAELEHLAERCRVSLLVVCHTVSADGREAALAIMQRHCPEMKSLTISKQYYGVSSYPVVYVAEGPAGLVARVGQMVGREAPARQKMQAQNNSGTFLN